MVSGVSECLNYKNLGENKRRERRPVAKGKQSQAIKNKRISLGEENCFYLAAS